MLQNLKSWSRKNICQFFRDKMLKLWKHICQVEEFLGQAYSLDGTNPNRTLLVRTRRLHELRLLHFQNCVLRQVSGINKLIKMSTYRLACGDSEITWVEWPIQPNTKSFHLLVRAAWAKFWKFPEYSFGALSSTMNSVGRSIWIKWIGFLLVVSR